MTTEQRAGWRRKRTGRLSCCVFLLIAVSWAIYICRHRAEFHLLVDFSPPALLFLLPSALALALLNSLQLRVLTCYLGLNLPFAEWFGLHRLSLAANSCLPLPGGVVLKAAYLRNYHGVPVPVFAAVSAAALVVRLEANALLALVLVTFVPAGRACTITALLMTAAVIVIQAATRWFPDKVVRFLPPTLNDVLSEWRLLLEHPGAVGALALLNLAAAVLSSVRLWAAFLCFGISVPVPSCVLITSLAVLARLINLTPGNVGFRETVIAGLTGALGSSVNAGLHAAALERFVEMVLNAIFAGYMLKYKNSMYQSDVDYVTFRAKEHSCRTDESDYCRCSRGQSLSDGR